MTDPTAPAASRTGWIAALVAVIVAAVLAGLQFTTLRRLTEVQRSAGRNDAEMDLRARELASARMDVEKFRAEAEGNRRSQAAAAAETAKLREEIGPLRKELQQNASELGRLRVAEYLLSDPETRVHGLAGTDAAKGASGRVIWKGADAVLVVRGLADPGPGRGYALWAMLSRGTESAPVSAGIFDAKGHPIPDMPRFPAGLGEVSGFAVTVETLPGGIAPTGPRILDPAK